MPRSVRALLVLGAAVLVAAGLGGCQSPTDATSTSAQVTLTASPNPAGATPSSGVFYILQGDANNPDQTREYPFQASFTLDMAETEGAGLDIIAITLKVQQASGGIITPPTNGLVEHYQFSSQASGNRLEGHGNAHVNFNVWYALPNLGREAVATVSVTFLDKKDVNNTSDDVSFAKALDVRLQ